VKLCFSTSFVLLYFGVVWPAVSAQAKTKPSCPVIATLPADTDWTEPLESRRRFQLRQCHGDPVLVDCFEKGKATPSLTFNTGDGYPRYLVHSFDVLVLQSMGGSADHVYVLLFNGGKPSLALRTATKGLIQVAQATRTITVIVPPPTYPGPDGDFPPTPKPKTYSFPIQN
jgi:hypothetical protein